ncbi:SUN domain-containing protein 3 [Drosophila tropicalis]|uniref:SUN domain-containing protein 3 n=1 Tax=Drosophila tropicalis TaxID=46794 RepID=UPI0035AC07DB
MDCSRRPPIIVCITYVITFLLLSGFFYILMSENTKNIEGFHRIRDELREISDDIRGHSKDPAEPGPSKFGCLAGEPKPTAAQYDSRDMNTYVDSIIRRKFGHLLDDMHTLKKQIINTGCNSNYKQTTPKSEPVAMIKNRINYASEDLGAKVINVLALPIRVQNIWQILLGLDYNSNPPVNMLRPSLTTGACFCYNGCKATIAVRLAKKIVVDTITYTHVAKEMTPNLCVNSAPKDFDVYGVHPDTSKRELLGHWIYNNVPNRRTQSYSINNKAFFQKLVFVFNSNHGANSTCLY